ncbi:MAG: ribonuclease J [Anaerolineae bacterium]|nr:ribonuclease J [Anaerolineae bacterium]
MTTNRLTVIPIGGLGEVGKNMMAFIYGNEAIIVDAGMMFPENDMPGIDYIIPDFRFLSQQSDLKVHAIIITHGHEDHTGAISHVVQAFPAPIYATPLTCGLLEVKLKRDRRFDSSNLIRFEAGDVLKLGPFTVDTFHVCHSIPDCVGLGIDTPVGLVVHTGDFKIDHTPVDNWPTDFAKLAEFSRRGVLALFSDSTNAERPGWTPSESVIDAAFDRVFSKAQGRIIISTFASLISRIQQVAWAAQRFDRKMAIAGTSMSENVRMARNLGYLEIPPEMLISTDEAKNLPPEKVVIIATGTQGEPSSVLSRLAHGRHPVFSIDEGDTVIISAHPIPGNEEMVSRTINRLIQRGAAVIYEPIEQVHVSGHASQEEQKLMINLVRPKYFVPIHGELRQLTQHAALAERLGIPHENIAVVENGTTLTFTSEGQMKVGERKPGGYVFVDGARVGDVGPAIMRDREILARDGVVVVNVVYQKSRGVFLTEPEIITRGFIFQPDSAALLDEARQIVRKVVKQNTNGNTVSLVQEALSKLFASQTGRHPVVFAFVNEV